MIGNAIKKLRKEKKLTLEQLANNLNASYPDTVNFNKGKLSKWENGREEPKLSSIRILADYFKVSIDSLYRNGENDIIPVYDQLNETNKKATYDFAKERLREQQTGEIRDFYSTYKLDTLAAHSDDPNRTYTEEEILNIKENLERITNENNIDFE